MTALSVLFYYGERGRKDELKSEYQQKYYNSSRYEMWCYFYHISDRN